MSKGFKIAHNLKDFVDGQVFLLKVGSSTSLKRYQYIRWKQLKF